jgi:putative chitinase
MISTTQLRAIMPSLSEDKAALWISPLNDAMTAFGIDQNAARTAMFLGQVAEESGELKYTRELASGAAYELRKDLGNTEPGDGYKYRGRGLLQITGRKNYSDCSLALYGDDRLIEEPELLEQPVGAAQSAGWFWQAHGLSLLADAGRFEAVTRVINGGTNGMDVRLAYYGRARTALAMAA